MAEQDRCLPLTAVQSAQIDRLSFSVGRGSHWGPYILVSKPWCEYEATFDLQRTKNTHIMKRVNELKNKTKNFASIENSNMSDGLEFKRK